MRKPQLVAPAGDLEKLKAAVTFGADAVYAGGEDFSLRAKSRNFTTEEFEEGIKFAHDHGVKFFTTVNIYAFNEHFNRLPDYLLRLEKLGVDGIIVSDPGIIATAKRVIPNMPIHLSTQANCTNVEAAKFWKEQGIKRIVLARELPLADAERIGKEAGVETEIFGHGAMCMAYSGRCLISHYVNNRSANLGDCTQPCRWHYDFVEEKRPNDIFSLEEDQWGSYIFNSKDICLIDFLPEIMKANIGALKIEGRMKSVYYVANVVRIYREAIDTCFNDIENYKAKDEWHEELEKVSHRPYSAGFACGEQKDLQIYTKESTIRGYDFSGLITSSNGDKAYIQQRNHLKVGDTVEIITPKDGVFTETITGLWDEEMNPLETMPHPKQRGYMSISREYPAGSVIRRPVREGAVEIR